MQKIKCPDCETLNLSNARFCAGCGHALAEVPSAVAELSALPPVSKTKPSQRNKIVAGIAVGIVFWAIVYMVQRTYVKPFVQDKVLQLAAAQASTQCPIMVDETTRMDSVGAGPGNALRYYFTLVGIERSQVDTAVFLQQQVPHLTENIRTNDALRVYREYKTTMIYAYHDNSAKHIASITVTPEMYE